MGTRLGQELGSTLALVPSRYGQLMRKALYASSECMRGSAEGWLGVTLGMGDMVVSR